MKPTDLPPHLPGRLTRTDTAEYQLVALDDGDPPNGLYRRVEGVSLLGRYLLLRTDGTHADWTWTVWKPPIGRWRWVTGPEQRAIAKRTEGSNACRE